MGKKEIRMELFDKDGLMLDKPKYEHTAMIMESNQKVDHIVTVEGVVLGNGHFRKYKTLDIYTREDYEHTKNVSFNHYSLKKEQLDKKSIL